MLLKHRSTWTAESRTLALVCDQASVSSYRWVARVVRVFIPPLLARCTTWYYRVVFGHNCKVITRGLFSFTVEFLPLLGGPSVLNNETLLVPRAVKELVFQSKIM